MINPFLEFTLITPDSKFKSKTAIHMSNIEAVIENGGQAIIYSQSGVRYCTTANYLTIMGLWQKYEREMQEVSGISEIADEDDQEDDENLDATPFES